MAYREQKHDKVVNDNLISQRTLDQKKIALVDQEAALQERIDKAQSDMEKAKQLRDKMGIVKEEKPAPVETVVTKPANFGGSANNHSGFVSPR